eukprot:4194021-Alexandrium_andersonii.AAC.1
MTLSVGAPVAPAPLGLGAGGGAQPRVPLPRPAPSARGSPVKPARTPRPPVREFAGGRPVRLPGAIPS